MKCFLTGIILFFTTCFLWAQDNSQNREAYLLKMPLNDSIFYKQQIHSTPYFVKEKVLQLYTGEKLCIEIETTNDSISSMTVVRKNLNPEKTLEIELSQKTEGRTHKGITLKLKNPFNQDLEYKAFMAIYGVKQWVPTNVYPIKAKLSSYEMWPDPIISLLLTDWTLKKAK